jgi:hypothetical protein
MGGSQTTSEHGLYETSEVWSKDVGEDSGILRHVSCPENYRLWTVLRQLAVPKAWIENILF